MTGEAVVNLQSKICPEASRFCLVRYDLLRTVYRGQPVGRRALADLLVLQERKIRKELAFLVQHGLLIVGGQGVNLTEDGLKTLRELEQYVRLLHGLSRLEGELCKIFGLEEAIIVPGDCDRDEMVKKDLARVTAEYLKTHLKEGSILAVTGGTTLAEVGAALHLAGERRDLLVVPARGGLGEEVELQANAAAANMARGLGGSYRLLHVPDDLSPETLQTIVHEPKVREVVDLMRRADLLLHGVGVAEEMARRRGMSADTIAELLGKGAVGEALGYYYGGDGGLVHTTSSVGLQEKEMRAIGKVVMVGGGHSKARAAQAILRSGGRKVFLTDEAVAAELLRERMHRAAKNKAAPEKHG